MGATSAAGALGAIGAVRCTGALGAIGAVRCTGALGATGAVRCTGATGALSLGIVLLGLFASSALGQERLFAVQNGRYDFLPTVVAELDTSDGTFGQVRRVLHVPTPALVNRLAGGRYLIIAHQPNYTGRVIVGVFDTRSFTFVHSLTFPGHVTLVPDEFHPRVFYRTPTEVGVLELPLFARRVLRATPDIAVPDSSFCCGWLWYAEATSSLFIPRTSPRAQSEILAINPATGTSQGVLTVVGAGATGLLVDDAARRLYVPVTLGFSRTLVRTYDLDTFALLTETAEYEIEGPSWSFDITRQQILATRAGGSSSWPQAFSLDTALRLQGSVDFGYLRPNPGSAFLHLAPSTVRNRIFAVAGNQSTSTTYTDIPGSAFLVRLDATSLQPTTMVDLLKIGTFFGNQGTGALSAILLSPPPPPTPLRPVVNNRHVQLIWRNPGDTTHFVVEVGTTAGRSNLGIVHVGNVTSWNIDNVPPGQYYVRVRAINDVGLSLPSNEVVVTVP